jgi:hypothetical protein
MFSKGIAVTFPFNVYIPFAVACFRAKIESFKAAIQSKRLK